MSVGRHLSLMLIALIFTMTIIPQAQAAANCQLKPSCSIGEVHVANVADATYGGHAAPNTSGVFSDQMCCEANFTDPGLGLSPAFSISTVDGNQGHVSEAGEFDFDIQSSYHGCLIDNRDENEGRDEVCIAGVTNSGTLPGGDVQGHLTNCGNTSHKIICCPFGYNRTGPDRCTESGKDLDILAIHGLTTIDVNSDYVYDLEIQWLGVNGIEGEFYATRRGTSIREGGDFTFTHPSYIDRVNFTETFNFPSVGNYTIHAEAQKTNGANYQSYSIDVEVVNSSCVNNARIIEGTHFDACALTPSDLPPMPPNVTWTPAPSYDCAIAAETCYTGMCTPPFTFNTTTRTCDGPGAGSPMTPQVQLEANPIVGPAPLDVNFTINITDDSAPVRYELFFDNGDSTGEIPGPHTINTIEYYTYNQPGEYLARLNARDKDGNTNVSTAFVNVTNNIPIITISASPMQVTAPNNSTLTIEITDDSPNVTVNITHEGTLIEQMFFEEPYNTPNSTNVTLTSPIDYVYNVTAEDTYGVIARANTTVTGLNNPPQVTLTANPQELPAPNSTNITVTVNDDSPTVRVRLYNGTTQIGSQMVFNSYPGTDSRTFNFEYPGLYTMKRMIFMQDHYSSEYKTLFTV